MRALWKFGISSFHWRFPFTRYFQSMFKILKDNLPPFLFLYGFIFFTKFLNSQSLRIMSFAIRTYFFQKRTYLFLRWCFIDFDVWFFFSIIMIFTRNKTTKIHAYVPRRQYAGLSEKNQSSDNNWHGKF